MQEVRIKEVTVPDVPGCDYCTRPALYDSPTRKGFWAHMCGQDMHLHGRAVQGLMVRLRKG